MRTFIGVVADLRGNLFGAASGHHHRFDQGRDGSFRLMANALERILDWAGDNTMSPGVK